MLTPTYGMIKQFCYREVLSYVIYDRYKNKPIVSVSLGGAHCLDNPGSCERRIIENNPNSTVVIVDRDLKSVKNILKRLKNVQREKCGNGYTYLATIGNVSIEVYHGTMKSYLLWAKKLNRKHDVVIADYFTTLNNEVIAELKILRDERLLNKNSKLFVTAASPRWGSGKGICQLVLNRDTKPNKKYRGGMREFLKYIFNSKGSTVKNIMMHSYSNVDINTKSMEMNVAIMTIA